MMRTEEKIYKVGKVYNIFSEVIEHNMVESDFILSGPVEEEIFPPISLGKLFFDKIKLFGDKIAFADDEFNEKITYKELFVKSICLAASLKKLGLKQNDTIALISENNIYYFIPYLACLYNGYILHLLNHEITSYELNHFLNLTRPIAIFFSTLALPVILEVTTEITSHEILILLNSSISKGEKNIISMNDLLNPANINAKDFEPETLNAEEQVAVIFNSSGTTGLPKGVMLTHANLKHNLSYLGKQEYFALSENKTIICIVPCNHLYGSLLALIQISLGSNTLFCKKFKPQIYLGLIEKYKIERLHVVPTLVLFLAESELLKNYNLESVQEIFSGSMHLKRELQETIEKKLSACVYQVYGSTEAGGAVFCVRKNGRSYGSVGRLLPNFKAKITCLKTGKALGPNKKGEICFNGSSVMKGYINNLQATKEAIDEDGYLHSGDVGYYDQEENFYIMDRLKDIIKWKGFQVSPVEIESVLLTHKAIKDAAVVGLPNERAGELPLAFIVTEPDCDISENDIIDFVAEKFSPQKRLYGGVIFTDHIPKNSAGKVLKKELRLHAQIILK